jgi:putative hemolysin
LVRDNATGEVIGCTRILTQHRAPHAGGFYSQQEFAIDNVLALPGRFMEIGRTCVHRDYRNGATITALWSGLARFVNQHGFDYLIGCASVPLGQDGASAAHAIYRDLSRRYLVSEALRVVPLTPLPQREETASGPLGLPPLLKAYLRVGAKICGEPCLDSDFNIADLFILMPTKNLDRRYSRHFMERS